MTIFQISILFFIAALLVIVALYLSYATVTASPRHELRKRLRRLALDLDNRRFPEDLRVEIIHEMSPLDRVFLKLALFRKLDILIDKAGLRTDLKVFVLIIITAIAVGFFVGLMIQRGLFSAIVLAVVGGLAPIFYLRFKRSRRLRRFTDQFPGALDMIARSLRAGHSFTAAMQLVASELADPVSSLFKTAYDEQALGVSTREAIAHMTDRMDSTDLRFFVMAINIHREVGGNLGEILERLAKTIRERLTIRRQVRVYTTQARISGYILAAVPVFMALLFYYMVPGYIEELLDSKTGIIAIFMAVAAQVVGFLVIRKLVNIRI